MNQTDKTEQVVLIYDADAGLVAMAADVVKKLVGKEDCPLCEITHSPIGKRGEWAKCEQSLDRPVIARHRNELKAWKIDELPSVVLARGDDLVRVLVSAPEIAKCTGDASCLRDKIARALVS